MRPFFYIPTSRSQILHQKTLPPYSLREYFVNSNRILNQVVTLSTQDFTLQMHHFLAYFFV